MREEGPETPFRVAIAIRTQGALSHGRHTMSMNFFSELPPKPVLHLRLGEFIA